MTRLTGMFQVVMIGVFIGALGNALINDDLDFAPIFAIGILVFFVLARRSFRKAGQKEPAASGENQ